MISRGQEPFAGLAQGAETGSQLHALRVEVDLFGLPPALDRMNQLLTAAPVDLNRLGEAVAEDGGLVAETLKLCNSSLFGPSQPVASLEQAVIIMDAEIVRTLLFTCWLIRYTSAHIIARENRLFWRHSLLVAQLSRRICEWADYAQPERVFLAGLLHDAGILPFLTMFSRKGASSEDGIFEDVGDSIESQRRYYGIDHCELGRKMGSILGFPTSLVEAVARHHQRGAALSGMSPVCFVSAGEMISQAGNTGRRQSAPSAPTGQLIRNTLTEYLPGLSRPVSLGLVEALESDLCAGVSHSGGIPEDGWDDSLCPPEVLYKTGNTSNAKR
ncbi:MAG: HDOD domain-containing protein [Terriglobia bacterium]